MTSRPGLSTSPLDLSAGWYPRPRGLTSWSLYQSLGALGRRLVDVLLERARYRRGTLWILGHEVALQPGELIVSEEELARLCGRGTSRKVVRTALRRLEAGGFLVRRRALPAGQCPSIITIKDYGRLLMVAQEKGPQAGQLEGGEAALLGPGEGHGGAPIEQGRQGNTEELLLSPAATATAEDRSEWQNLGRDDSLLVACLPCVGKGPREFTVTERMLAGWREAFPGIDLRVEVMKAKCWLDANPRKRKTHSGAERFLLGWVGRAQDGAGRNAAPPFSPRLPTLNGREDLA
jgi:hypothetical protein